MKGKRSIYVLCGIAGSGKSSFLEKTPSSEDLILRRDSFSNIHGYCGDLWRDFVNNELWRYPNKDVYIDQVTLRLDSLKRLIFGMSFHNVKSIYLLVFDTPLEVCRERVLRRERCTQENLKDGLKYIFNSGISNPLIEESELSEIKTKIKENYDIGLVYKTVKQ